MTSIITPEAPTLDGIANENTNLIITTEPRFNAQDRCDTCGSRAYIGATVNGTELLYCAHHGEKYKENLQKVATIWHDETQILLAYVKPSASAV